MSRAFHSGSSMVFTNRDIATVVVCCKRVRHRFKTEKDCLFATVISMKGNFTGGNVELTAAPPEGLVVMGQSGLARADERYSYRYSESFSLGSWYLNADFSYENVVFVYMYPEEPCRCYGRNCKWALCRLPHYPRIISVRSESQ